MMSDLEKCGARVIRTRLSLRRYLHGFYPLFSVSSPANPLCVGSGVLMVFSWTCFRPGTLPVVDSDSLMEATHRFSTRIVPLLLGLILIPVVIICMRKSFDVLAVFFAVVARVFTLFSLLPCPLVSSLVAVNSLGSKSIVSECSSLSPRT